MPPRYQREACEAGLYRLISPTRKRASSLRRELDLSVGRALPAIASARNNPAVSLLQEISIYTPGLYDKTVPLADKRLVQVFDLVFAHQQHGTVSWT